jgi:hypothetical protein
MARSSVVVCRMPAAAREGWRFAKPQELVIALTNRITGKLCKPKCFLCNYKGRAHGALSAGR